jgi:hypothetical protein
MVDFTKLAQAAAAAGMDQTKVQEGGDYTPPAEGSCRLRLVSYIELGMHEGSFQGKPKKNNKVVVQFEVSGPKHPPIVMEDGTKRPVVITIRENLSQSDKARFFKLFGILNYAGAATHMVGLLGRAYKGRIVHRKYKGKDQKEHVAAELFDKTTGAWTIEAPRYEVVDPESGPTGEYKELKVDAPISPIKAFVWNLADMEQWSSIFIDGQYPERKNEKGEVTAPAKSKNEFQNAIKSAINFTGSPIHQLLATAGENLDVPEAERPDTGDEDEGAPWDDKKVKPAVYTEPPKGKAADSALDGIVD